MNAKRLIVSTSSKDLTPLTHHGAQVASLYEQIRLVLESVLSPDDAAVLSEPLIETDQGLIDWYTSLPGEIVPLGQVSPEQREEAIQRLSSYATKIEELGKRYRESKDSQQRRIGNMLKLILEYPGESAIYLVDGKPIIVGWGTTPAGQAAAPERLTRLTPVRSAAAKRRPPKVEAAKSAQLPPGKVEVATQKRRWGCASWPLMGLLLGLLVLALLLGMAYFFPGCAGPYMREGGAGLSEAQNRQAVLLERRARLREEYLQRRRDCPGCNGPADNIEQRRRQAGGTIGPLTITLSWNGKDDLDLHVVEPNGYRIYYSSMGHLSPSGGHYEVDANDKGWRIMSQPVENIKWSEAPPAGVYTVGVVLFDDREPRGVPTDYTIEIVSNGNTRRYNGTISPNQSGPRRGGHPYNEVVKFTYTPPTTGGN